MDAADSLIMLAGMLVLALNFWRGWRNTAQREVLADIGAALAEREEFRARHLSAAACATQHHVEDVVSCGVIVARLCVDCDKQLDAPEWLAVAS